MYHCPSNSDANSPETLRVLVVDDSALARRFISTALSADPVIEVIGTAADTSEAMAIILDLKPDVMTLDVTMPGEDGISFLRRLMKTHPIPVVMVSAITSEGAATTLEALALGAVGFIAKPSTNKSEHIQIYIEELANEVKMASHAKVSNQWGNQAPKKKSSVSETSRPSKIFRYITERSAAPSMPLAPFSSSPYNEGRVIGIGASVGGTEAIARIMQKFPQSMPPIMIVLHLPNPFTKAYAERLNKLSAIRVVEARNNMRLEPGVAYLAPGNFHLSLSRKNDHLTCRVYTGDKVNYHRPSVDVLFHSLAENLPDSSSMGIILTGMGSDGAKGLKAMHDQNCFTIAQDESTSVVWGMPGMAFRIGAAEKILPLQDISESVLKWVHQKTARLHA